MCFPVNIAKLLEHLFYRTPLVAVSGKIRTKSLKLTKFQFQLFLTTLNIHLHCDKIVVKRDIHRKKFVVVSTQIVIQTSFVKIKIKTVCSDAYSTVAVPLHSQSGWCLEIVFLNDLSVENTSLFTTFITRKRCDSLTSQNM